MYASVSHQSVLSIEEDLIEGSTLRGEDGGQDGYVVLLSQCLGRLQGLLHIDLTVSEG